MTPERWKQIQDNLDLAVALAPLERESFLNQLGNTDLELRKELESLLAYETKDAGFLQTAALGSLAHGEWREPKRTSLLGRVFGPYRLTELLGAGGMGDVYRAVRVDGQYEQQVALKIVRSDFAGELTARFRNERQILASLDHPNIARILDGSTTEDGIPYIVIELIEGLPITEYCDQHHLPIDDRLKLFRTVCSAVHYAHQHLVVHRDIKPSNILVTADGIPKLLDFGIAKILDANAASENATRTGMLMMTPEYASPEQLRGEPITTATDVYSLGLILYELLTGCHPFRVRGNVPHEIARGVLEMEPERPSAALRRKETDAQNKQKNRAAVLAEGDARSVPPKNLGRLLSGDLDSIVLKALRKEPRDRYNSADQLSEDIRRHLEGLPVLARKGTLSYRVSKYVLRHKVAAVSVVLVFLMLLVGIVVTLREARIARSERVRAELRFNDVRSLSNTLLFQINDAIKDVPGTTQAQQLVISSAQKYLDSLSQEAGGDLSLLRELATGYQRLGQIQGGGRAPNLGNSRSAIESYRKAVGLREAISKAKPSDPQAQHELQKSYDEIGYVFLGVDQKQSADYFQKSMSIATALVTKNPVNSDFLRSLVLCYEHQAMALIHKGDMKGALESQQESLRLAQKLVDMAPNESYRTDLSYAHKRVGALLIQGEKLPQALAEYQAALALDEALLSAHPNDSKLRFAITFAYSDIGYIYNKQGNRAAGLASYHKALDIRQALADADPHDARARLGVARTCAYIGNILRDRKQFQAALSYNLRELAIQMDQAAANPSNATDRIDLAGVWWDLGSDYRGIAGKVKSTAEKLRFLHLAQNYLTQALPLYRDAETQGLLLGDQLTAPQDVSRDLAKCTRALRAAENVSQR